MKKLSTLWQHIRWQQGTVAVVVQRGEDGVVLTSARLNREALIRNMISGAINLFSLTKNALRMKGEKSMHFQYLENLSFDCDYDAALMMVNTKTAACHNNVGTCFYNSLESEWFSIVEHAIRCLTERGSSYVYSLVCNSVSQIVRKVHEELVELNQSAQALEYLCVTKEVSDVCFHILVLLLALNIDPSVIILELKTRTLISGACEKRSRK